VLLVQEIMAVTVEMVAVVVEPQTIQEQAALVALAFFIYITKEINNGNVRNDERQYSFKCNCGRR
jgi:hypothetical protein